MGVGMSQTLMEGKSHGGSTRTWRKYVGFVIDPVDAEFVVDKERVLLPGVLRCYHAFHYTDCLHSIIRLPQTLYNLIKRQRC